MQFARSQHQQDLKHMKSVGFWKVGRKYPNRCSIWKLRILKRLTKKVRNNHASKHEYELHKISLSHLYLISYC